MNELFEKSNEFLIQYDKNLQTEMTKMHQAHNDGADHMFWEETDLAQHFWLEASNYYILGAVFEYHKILNKELKELNDNGIYFHYCKFKTYEKTYEERLGKFLEIFEDADPIYFLQDELKKYLKPIDLEKPFKCLDDENRERLSYTRDRTVGFLVEQGKKIGYNITVEVDEFEGTLSYKMQDLENIIEKNDLNNTVLSLQWNGDKSNLVELIEALLVNGNIKGVKKDIYKVFEDLFKLDFGNTSIIVSKFKDRNANNETKFLNELTASLLNEINTRLEKNRR
jgi:hypothetical protein